MIRVVFLIRSLGRGGSERQLATLARALNRERFEVTVITFYPGGDFEKELADGGVRVVSLRKRGRWDILGFLWRLRRALGQIRPHVIHSYLVEPNLLAVLFKPLSRPAKVVWGIRASKMDLSRYDWFARVNFRLQTFASRFADKVIFNSNAGRDYHVARGFPARRCAVIHGGVDAERFKPDRESGRRIREAWAVDDDALLIGLVGRLDPMKDHRTFLKAAELLSRRDFKLRFACVGGGPEGYAARLRRIAEDYKLADVFIWAGERRDMPAVYNALDIACSSSSGEGMPNAIAEAMACGVPCVVTDVGDSALLVGEAGIVVSPGDPPALSEGLARCLNMLKAGEARSPRPRVAEHFSVSKLVSRTEAVLSALAEN
jgi:glycosyltransferase involved in cell wall biosynthesis